MNCRRPDRFRCMTTAGQMPNAAARSAFTLVELLVVIGLMMLLVTITVLSVDFAFDGETVTGSARQLQGFMEGARDRAIYAREPRGIRLLVREDSLNGRTVASAVYIKPQRWSEGVIQLSSNTGDQLQRNVVVGQGTLWGLLRSKKLLPTTSNANPWPVRIRLPREDGRWYAARPAESSDTLPQGVGVNNALILQIPFTSSEYPNSYELELPPTVVSNQPPLLLPAGVVIDLDASKVPDAWRPASGSDLAQSYSAQMDIMFSPRGTVMGRSAAEGMIHLCLGSLSEIDELNSGLIDQGAGPRLYNRSNQITPLGPGVPTELLMGTVGGQQGDRLVVSVWTSTGGIAVSPIDPTPLSDVLGTVGPGDLNNYAADPFRFANGGQEAKP